MYWFSSVNTVYCGWKVWSWVVNFLSLYCCKCYYSMELREQGYIRWIQYTYSLDWRSVTLPDSHFRFCLKNIYLLEREREIDITQVVLKSFLAKIYKRQKWITSHQRKHVVSGSKILRVLFSSSVWVDRDVMFYRARVFNCFAYHRKTICVGRQISVDLKCRYATPPLFIPCSIKTRI